VPKKTPKIVVIGKIAARASSFENKLRNAGFHAISSELDSDGNLPELRGPDIVIFLSQLDREPRTKLAKVLRQRHPSIKIVMLYEEKIAGAEIADAVINTRCTSEDLTRTLRYLSGDSFGTARGA
jgi:hypothetical protein